MIEHYRENIYIQYKCKILELHQTQISQRQTSVSSNVKAFHGKLMLRIKAQHQISIFRVTMQGKQFIPPFDYHRVWIVSYFSIIVEECLSKSHDMYSSLFMGRGGFGNSGTLWWGGPSHWGGGGTCCPRFDNMGLISQYSLISSSGVFGLALNCCVHFRLTDLGTLAVGSTRRSATTPSARSTRSSASRNRCNNIKR